MRQWLRQHTKQLIALTIWVIIAIIMRWWMQSGDLTFAEVVISFDDAFHSGWYGVLLYMLIYFLRPLTLFPGTPLSILAGMLYGFWAGWIIALVAGLLSTILPYAFGRWLATEDYLNNRTGIQKWLIEMMRDNPFQTVLTTRFLYLPYDTVNAIAGALRISFVPFFVATAIGNSITTAAIVSIGASLESNLADGDFAINPSYLLVAGVVWLISLVMTRLIKRYNNTTNESLKSTSGEILS